DGGEYQRPKAGPHHAAIAAVSIHLGQDIAEDIRNWEEQYTRQKGDCAKKWHVGYRGFLRGADKIGAEQDADIGRHHEIVIAVLTGRRRSVHAFKHTHDMSHRLRAWAPVSPIGEDHHSRTRLGTVDMYTHPNSIGP